MSGPRDKFDDGELDELVQDFELDMDAPIGATFAAALRDAEGGLPVIDDFDADEFLPEPPPAPRAAVAPVAPVFAHEHHEHDADGEGEIEVEMTYDEEYLPEEAHASAPSQPWLQPKPSVAPVEDLPPMTARDAEPVADDVAGAGLGYDYSFGATHDGGDRTIPRITVHAFCNRTSSLSLMRSITQDRRMKNVTMETFEGGVAAAIQYYVNETTPNLLVIEGAGDPRQLLADLDSLAEYCDENIKVMVLGQTNDIRLYRELMRRGVSEYLVAPIDPVQMIRSIATLFADPEAPFTGKSIAITGVKGGVGASTIAHNLAWALSERCKVNSTLVDLDLNFGTTGLDFNQDTQATIADALMSPDRFDDAIMGRLITKATDRLSLFTAPATLDRTYNLDPDTYVRVLDQVRASVPFMVLDLPHIWTDWFKSTVIQADELVVVAGPDLASLRNGKNLIDFLKAARPNDNPPKLVLNMVGLPKRPEIPAKDFGQAIGIEPSLIIPFDAQLFGTAANNGQMVFDVAPESKVAQELDRLAAQLTGKEVQATKPSLLKKLLGK